MLFFKQKTAYEMRISDWSSDVCSSDLVGREDAQVPAAHRTAQGTLRGRQAEVPDGDDGAVQEGEDQSGRRLPAAAGADAGLPCPVLDPARGGRAAPRTMDRLDPEPDCAGSVLHPAGDQHRGDRKSTRLNSSH